MLRGIPNSQATRGPTAVIAMAASAGGVEALMSVIGNLPADTEAAVLVVLHIAPVGPSVLPAIIGRHSRLPASQPADGEEMRPGHVYVAPPDHHLILEDDRLRVVRGPRENGHRPAADPLFRSVAFCCGTRCAGVVLSGALDDGTSGLAAIKDAGGLTVVQDPEEAAFPGMPLNAINYVHPDHVASTHEIAQILTRFAKEVTTMSEEGTVRPDDAGELPFDEAPSEFTCPDCGGSLWMVGDRPMRFRCRVGHSFSADSLTLGKQDAIESALWAAIVALEERADLARRLLRRAAASQSDWLSTRFVHDIKYAEEGAVTLRRLAAELIGSAEHVVKELQGGHGHI